MMGGAWKAIEVPNPSASAQGRYASRSIKGHFISWLLLLLPRRKTMSSTLNLSERFARFPLGSVLFSRALAFRAPYFATIRPHITDLRSGYCRVRIKDRRSIRNHLGSIHAGALCTLSELTGGLAVEATLPSNLRWIPREMTVQYIKKARGNLVAECSVDPSIFVPGDVEVPLEIMDGMGDTVLSAVIVFYVSERKPGN
jgi:uncharacterized protein (TIGR00369 family)